MLGLQQFKNGRLRLLDLQCIENRADYCKWPPRKTPLISRCDADFVGVCRHASARGSDNPTLDGFLILMKLRHCLACRADCKLHVKSNLAATGQRQPLNKATIMNSFISLAPADGVRTCIFSLSHSPALRQPARRRAIGHTAALQQQPKRRFEWQQQQGSTEFQPVLPRGSFDPFSGEDNQPDKDGHPRIF